MDLSHQGIVLHCAVIPVTSKLASELGRSLLDPPAMLPAKTAMSIRVDDEELLLWKYALPAFVERCRDWKHTSTCEYKSTRKIPPSTKASEPILCSCGTAKFPDDWKIENRKLWDQVCKYAVRAAISLCFAVPFIDKTWGHIDAKVKVSLTQEVNRLSLGKGCCATCGRTKAVNGGALYFCGGCGKIQYCSKKCQETDWKEKNHRVLCRALRDGS